MPVIAIDLGGTKLAAALFNDEGEILQTTTTALNKRTGSEAGDLIVEQINVLLEFDKEKRLTTTALGICVPGIAYRSGNVWAPNIGGWDDYPLKQHLQSSLDEKISISIDSDRACYILGEAWKGNAQGCSDAIFLSVGTGIGAGIMVHGQVLRGAHDIAGAIGWMGLDRPFDSKYTSCGCFEYNASGEGLVNVYREMIADAEVTTRSIFEAYEKGDPVARKVITNAIECWGMAVANLVSLFNPEKIIFGGGVFGPALRFLDDIYEEAKRWAQPISIQQVKLSAAALGNEAGLYGAARLALKNQTTSTHV